MQASSQSSHPVMSIIETSPTSQQVLELLAISMGITVQTFTPEAFETTDIDESDLVIVEWDAVNLQGEHIALLCLYSDFNVPTIVLSEQRDIRFAVNVMKLGASDYITKPFDLDMVKNAIQEALSKRPRSNDFEVLPVSIQEQLTPEQCRILLRLLNGATVKSIANELDCSVRTIHYRKAEAFRTLEVASRNELLARVREACGLQQRALLSGPKTRRSQYAPASHSFAS